MEIGIIRFFLFVSVAYKGAKRASPDFPGGKRWNLWLLIGHFDDVKSLKAFSTSKLYCLHCDVPYEEVYEHRCADAWYICKSTGSRVTLGDVKIVAGPVSIE